MLMSFFILKFKEYHKAPEIKSLETVKPKLGAWGAAEPVQGTLWGLLPREGGGRGFWIQGRKERLGSIKAQPQWVVPNAGNK